MVNKFVKYKMIAWTMALMVGTSCWAMKEESSSDDEGSRFWSVSHVVMGGSKLKKLPLQLSQIELNWTILGPIKNPQKQETTQPDFNDYEGCLAILPDEHLGLVFRHVSTRDYIQLGLVSRRFHRVTHIKGVVLDHFKFTSKHPSFLGIRLKEIETCFNALWPVNMTVKKGKEQLQSFEKEFQEDIHNLWVHMKFHSEALKIQPKELETKDLPNSLDKLFPDLPKISSKIENISKLESSFYKNASSVAKKLLLIDHLTRFGPCSGVALINTQFCEYAKPLSLKLDPNKLFDYQNGYWRTTLQANNLVNVLNILQQPPNPLQPLNVNDLLNGLLPEDENGDQEDN